MILTGTDSPFVIVVPLKLVYFELQDVCIKLGFHAKVFFKITRMFFSGYKIVTYTACYAFPLGQQAMNQQLLVQFHSVYVYVYTYSFMCIYIYHNLHNNSIQKWLHSLSLVFHKIEKNNM